MQLASAQLTQDHCLVYRSAIRKLHSLFSFLPLRFRLPLLVRLGDTIPALTGYFAAYAFLFNIGLFLHFIERMGKSLRPSAALQMVGRNAREVIGESSDSSYRTESSSSAFFEAP